MKFSLNHVKKIIREVLLEEFEGKNDARENETCVHELDEETHAIMGNEDNQVDDQLADRGMRRANIDAGEKGTYVKVRITQPDGKTTTKQVMAVHHSVDR